MANYTVLPPIKANEKMIVLGGWILPNGDFYPAKYMRHNITAAHYFGVKYLKKAEAEKWAHLGDDGDVIVESKGGYRDYEHLTQAQIDTLFDISTVKARAQLKLDFQKNLTQSLKDILQHRDKINDQTH